ncbi:ubiquinol cytochrome C oxidoreductase [Fulvivirga sedimenti]|uniref:Ubiquinol cytochrome C oxidoreductase n=1 Tax=Fulvivirga sedimenti TaxID=2879465 RepID=A0A9X1HNY4_9BACT|nr:ubiquinol cytochrome C oxidoreductase [Fulvivirga sedimenti]MCA6074097.1 ubiquinol cytochrome C oxidoreductase [Fulvivirga sedimenti]
MINLTAYRRPTMWKNILAFMISLTFMIVWLPFIRSICDGSSYPWGTQYFGFTFYGNGITTDFIFVVIQFLFYVFLMYSIYRVKDRTIFYGLLLVWFVNVFGNLLYDIAVNGDSMFHGETLNVHISITWIVIPLSVLALFVIYKVIREDAAGPVVNDPWTRRNTLMAILILGPIPVQAVLLATGEPDGLTDQIGVLMSITQCFLLPFVYRPYKSVQEFTTVQTATE